MDRSSTPFFQNSIASNRPRAKGYKQVFSPTSSNITAVGSFPIFAQRLYFGAIQLYLPMFDREGIQRIDTQRFMMSCNREIEVRLAFPLQTDLVRRAEIALDHRVILGQCLQSPNTHRFAI